jgi:hypothetical protein
MACSRVYFIFLILNFKIFNIINARQNKLACNICSRSVKFSLSMRCSRIEGTEVYLHSLLTSAVDGGE